MLDNDHHHQTSHSAGRISFSHDFADAHHPIKQENSYKQAPVSADFEFSVPSNPMISANELFFKGKILPLKVNTAKTTTLREELLAGDDDDNDRALTRLIGGTRWWKEKVGLKRLHGVVPKKSGKNANGAVLDGMDEMKTPDLVSNDVHVSSKGERIAFWT